MRTDIHILMLEDNANDAELIGHTLKSSGLSFVVRQVENRAAFEAALGDFRPDLILSDYQLPGYNGEQALKFAQQAAPGTPFIMVTGALGDEAAVGLLKAGATDYVLKEHLVRLPVAVARALADAENSRSRREAEELLRISEARFRSILEHAPIGVGVVALDGRFIEANHSFCALTGYTREELLSLTFGEITHPEDRERALSLARRLLNGEINLSQMEKTLLRKDGKTVWVQVTTSLLRDSDGAPLNFIAQIEDVSERRRNLEEIRSLAYYDVLTGLPNRRLLLDRLGQALAQAQRHQRALAVMFLDLDRFKEVNDSLGHDAGDELLKIVAQRLILCVRSGDTVSRQGGDEFVVILSEIAQQEDAQLVAEKILETLMEPAVVQGRRINITTSIGIAVHSVGSENDAMRLLKKADLAMYEAKRAGRNAFRFYTGIEADGEPFSRAD